nr:hypothetical protein [Tanacetum cinerariifolium]
MRVATQESQSGMKFKDNDLKFKIQDHRRANNESKKFQRIQGSKSKEGLFLSQDSSSSSSHLLLCISYDLVVMEMIRLTSITRLISNIESLNENSTPDHVLNSFESDNSLSDTFSSEFVTFCDYTKETRSGNTTHADNSLPEYDSFCFEIEPDQERLINISDDLSNDPLLEEADLFLAFDNSIPPGIENVADDTEGDIRFLKKLLIDDFILSHESSDSNFKENPSIPRPPPEPPDAKTDAGEEILVVMNDKDNFDEDYYFFMFDKVFSFLSTESEDTIFDPASIQSATFTNLMKGLGEMVQGDQSKTNPSWEESRFEQEEEEQHSFHQALIPLDVPLIGSSALLDKCKLFSRGNSLTQQAFYSQHDIDEEPHAATAFMANLSSTSGTNGATTSYVNEVHTDANQIFDNANHLFAHEIHQEEHLDSDVELDIDDNTISYHQYQLDSEVQDVPTKVSSVSPGEISLITILDDLRNQLDGNLKVNQEQIMVNDFLRAELARSLGSSNLWYAKHAKIAQPTLYDGHALLKPTNTPVRVHDSEESLVQDEEQLQGKDDTIRKLHNQINSMSMLNVEPTVVRIQNDGFKITALPVENAKMKFETLTKMHSKPIVPEKPKVLAPGMYAISSKYIVPPRRVNRAELTHLPKKKKATFQESPRPSNSPTQKTIVQQNKKPNIHVNLSIGVKPATSASKPMSKSATRNHSTLPAKREKARRVEDHHRNLYKQNHVDSCLNV